MKPVGLRLALHSVCHCAPGGLLFKAAAERYSCYGGRLLKALFQHILDLFLSFSRAGLLSYSVPSLSLAGICYLTGKCQYLYVHSNFHVCISRSGNYGKLEGTQHCCQSVMYFRPLNGYLKHTKQQKIMSYISLCSCSPVSSVGMKAVTGHRAGGILKDIFQKHSSSSVKVLLIFFLCVYCGQNWTFCCFEVVLIIMVIQVYKWRAAWVISSN